MHPRAVPPALMCGEVLPEQVDALAQRAVLEGAQVRVSGPEPLGLGTCLRQQSRVREIGDLELGQAALARAEEVAGPAQRQVRFGKLEAVGGALHDAEPLLRLRIRLLAEQVTVRLMRAAANAPAELMEL